ncbi:hypothetical protein CIT292_05980 [Citrobacter youngae ATCC 29220]|uniref:Uncharacterized protein n=1 Tax=Citrobacter youngae ATCC 29220 TaxID=500640 RepID=D4B6P2_9ENTR|nr:hypothetical protein CIT292_05980 [Citrobacter youngae ATCC 29220]
MPDGVSLIRPTNRAACRPDKRSAIRQRNTARNVKYLTKLVK